MLELTMLFKWLPCSAAVPRVDVLKKMEVTACNPLRVLTCINVKYVMIPDDDILKDADTVLWHPILNWALQAEGIASLAGV